MIQLSSKNDDLSLCYDVMITHHNFCNFSNEFDYNSKTDVFGDFIYHIINQCGPKHLNDSCVRHKMPASRKQAKRDCTVYTFTHGDT